MSLPHSAEHESTALTAAESASSTEEESHNNALTEKSCENCHQVVTGDFCSNCGQSLDSTLKYFWVVILHLLDDIFSFDSRASRTLFPLIFRPGFLTNEYFSGRRVHYVPPIRLYLFISIVFFLTLKLTVSSEEKHTIELKNNKAAIAQVTEHIEKLDEKRLAVLTQKESTELTRINADLLRFNDYLKDLSLDISIADNNKLVKATRQLVTLELERVKIEAGDKSDGITIGNNQDDSLSFDFLSAESNKKLNDFGDELGEKAEKTFSTDTNRLVTEVLGKLPQLMFVLLPLFALLLKLVFIFSKRLYMEHLTVALHSHSFIFVSLLSIDLIDVTHDYFEEIGSDIALYTASALGGIGFIWLLWIPIYLFVMQKRVYKQGYIMALLTYSFVGTIYFILMALTTLVAIVWGLTSI
ncbi:DUF3667 domain-containing protein [Colwellia sp. D2M02]|uniref:DUF3667 domain-containing protein n=1 Tax=Colwellia sp. D2M02 TaxID=2841562 RepID=UPI001C09693A|nr:DUF3667 domain-containing protein [Colwellia sp. D2M02]MBU2893726.1 DUF3667 domain-containing protein [Colwellia sp. D2M02]